MLNPRAKSKNTRVCVQHKISPLVRAAAAICLGKWMRNEWWRNGELFCAGDWGENRENTPVECARVHIWSVKSIRSAVWRSKAKSCVCALRGCLSLLLRSQLECLMFLGFSQIQYGFDLFSFVLNLKNCCLWKSTLGLNSEEVMCSIWSSEFRPKWEDVPSKLPMVINAQ